MADQASLSVVGHQPRHALNGWFSSAIATAVLERSHGTVVVVPEAEPPTHEPRC